MDERKVMDEQAVEDIASAYCREQRDPVVMKLVAAKSDADSAAEIRAEMTHALTLVCRVMDRAKTLGLEAGFQLSKDGNNRQFISSLIIAKHF